MAVQEGVIHSLAKEHARVRNHAGNAAKLAREGAPDPVCDDALELLEHHLRRHFSLEEEGGYLVDVLEAAPGRTREVRALGEEHPRMLEELGAIRARLKEGKGWRDRFEIWLRTLREHEEAENELVLAALRTGDRPS